MKKRILSIVLTLCMVLMLVPATVFAEGGTTPTYDLWQVGDKIYYAETGTCTDFTTAEGGTELPQGDYTYAYKLPYSGTYVLKTDITMTQSKPQIHISTSDITLDLNGKVMTKYSGDPYILRIKANNATIQDSNGGGTINGIIDIEGINSSLTLNSGTIEEISCSGGTLYADGGTVSEADTNGANGTITQHTGTTGTTITGDVNNGCSQYGTISGGIFYGEVLNGGSGITSIISNGVFYGEVVNAYISNITGGVFHEEVKNYGTITGGVFYDKVVNSKEYSNIGTINSGVFYGGIEDYGGTISNPYHTVSFDLNGASGTTPVTQYFVNTNTAQALEPVAPTREGYEFAGWYNGDTKYDFTQNVTEDITLTAKWESAKAPVITGLEDGKTYCDTVQFEVSDNVGVASITANGVTLTPDANNKYTLEKGTGTVTVVAIDKANNQTSVTVTVNNGHTGGTATCTQKAKCAICGEEYGELANHSLSKTDAKEATCTEDGNIEYWHCKDCKKYFSDAAGTNEITLDDTIISKLSPEIIEGKGQSITAGEKKELSFTSNAAFSDFIRVELDGKTLDAKNYTAKEGSTIVTLKADYVSTLSAGEHTIGIVSTNGIATTTFTVNAKTVVDDDTKSPQTGDNSHMALWLALLFVSGCAMIGTPVINKKRKRSSM